jgi:hypothetical protein
VSNKVKREITKSEDKARLELQKELQTLIDKGASCRPWQGTRDIINPSTSEIVGVRPTFNINLHLEKLMFDRVEKALALLANTGAYIECNFGDYKLIATKAYPQDRNGETVLVLQFSLPSAPSTMSTTDEKFSVRIREMVESVTSTPAMRKEVKAEAKAEVDDDLPF